MRTSSSSPRSVELSFDDLGALTLDRPESHLRGFLPNHTRPGPPWPDDVPGAPYLGVSVLAQVNVYAAQSVCRVTTASHGHRNRTWAREGLADGPARHSPVLPR